MEEKPSAKKVKAEEEPVAKKVKTEEEHGHGSNTSSKSLDTAKADKLVWLMKLPQAVAKSWNSHPSSDPHPVAKVVLSFDPLEADETSAVQVFTTSLNSIMCLTNWCIRGVFSVAIYYFYSDFVELGLEY